MSFKTSNYVSTNIMGYDVFIGDLAKIDFFNGKKIINTINPHSYIVSKKDKSFQKALSESDVLLPDGSGIVMAAKYINKKHIKKIAGMDLHNHLLTLLNTKHGKCFYMGASIKTLNKIKRRLNREYPYIDAEFYSPPYKEHLSNEDNINILNAINEFKPDVLFIGMTAPKQEKWLNKHKDLIDTNVICSIGAVFDFYAGTVERSSQFYIDHHLEWLERFFHEPKRLWKRNFISTPLFLWDMLLYKLKIK